MWAGATTVDWEEVTEEEEREKKRLTMDQQEMKERSRLDRAGVG